MSSSAQCPEPPPVTAPVTAPISAPISAPVSALVRTSFTSRAKAALILMPLCLAQTACDWVEPSQLESRQDQREERPQRKDTPELLIDRPDLIAYAPEDPIIRQAVWVEITQAFPEVDPRYVGHPRVVEYVGSMKFDETGNAFVFDYDEEFQSKFKDLDKPGETRVMWAHMRSSSLFLIRYPHLPGAAQGEDPKGSDGVSLEAQLGEALFPDSGPDTPTDHLVEPSREVTNTPWVPSDTDGVLVKADTRFPVFEPHAEVKGRMYKRMLDFGGTTGALVGSRHFVTTLSSAATIARPHGTPLGTPRKLYINFRDRVQAGRNGDTRIGPIASYEHLFWMADFSAAKAGPKRQSLDLAWGVLDEPLGESVGYFGLSSTSPADLEREGLPLTNVGYPVCEDAGTSVVPPNCRPFHMFQDANACQVLGQASPGPMDASRAVQHSCDASRGHSGSPLILTRSGKFSVWALHSGRAASSEEGDALGNYATRLTPHRVLDIMPDMFNQYPRDGVE